MSSDPLPTLDGRRARRDQNRDRVVDALLDIYREGNLRPGVSEVAERSGVSHRSVFRYFEDLDELYRVAIERHLRSISDLLLISAIGEGPLDERVEAIIENRQEIYEVAAMVSRVGQMLAPVEPVIAERRRDLAARAVVQLAHHFATELADLPSAKRRPTQEALAAALSMDSVEYLRQVRGLSRIDTSAVLRVTVHGLLGAHRHGD